MLPFPLATASGYETWSTKLLESIKNVLGNFDSYEGKKKRATHLLPDHKFPEIRWNERTRETNDTDMSEKKIKSKFQLLDNQRNEQKREVCRKCYQTSKRGIIFGVEFFYQGGPDWPEKTPKNGKDAEQGCIGCGWYDISKWREELNLFLNKINIGNTGVK